MTNSRGDGPATNKYIETLKDENKRLKEERDALKAGKKAEEEKAKEESKKEAAQANQELQRVKTQLSLYRLLTQLDARPYPEEGADAFLCSCQNPSDKRGMIPPVLRVLFLTHSLLISAQVRAHHDRGFGGIQAHRDRT